ncbi:hypothetical protein OIO90_001646 [Microbotryomycetes sp. JL221]|nr:hypothetical protein OIO90_001646 [Microbotryomycetes sp. JL221]
MATSDSPTSAPTTKKPRHRAGKNTRRQPVASTPNSTTVAKSNSVANSGRKQSRNIGQVHNKDRSGKGGFKVGPKLGKGQYTGHLKKTKQTLIHKAKIKRQFQKDLIEAGYSSVPKSSTKPQKGTSNANNTILGKRKFKGPSNDVIDADEASDDEADQPTEQDKEAERERLRRRLYGDDDGHTTSEDENDDDEQDRQESRTRTTATAVSNRARNAFNSTEHDDEDASEDEQEFNPNEDDSPVLPRPKPRLPQPKPPRPVASELAQHRPLKRPRLTSEQIDQLRKEREKERKVYSQRTSRGQPKLGSQIEHLLGKIQKSMGR